MNLVRTNLGELPNYVLSPEDAWSHSQFSQHFTNLDSTRNVVQSEDKSNTESWQRSRRGYILSLLCMACMAGWTLMPTTTVLQAHHAMVSYISTLWPPRFRFMLVACLAGADSTALGSHSPVSNDQTHPFGARPRGRG